jgi:hypothetical protein
MPEDYEIYEVDGGHEPPIMLAVRAPGQVAAQPDPSGAVVRRGAVSGNANADPVTGRFAGKKLKALRPGGALSVVAETIQGGALPTQTGVPSGVDPIVWARRMAAVRDAARQLDELTADTVRTFLAARVADVNQVDIAQFLADSTWQRIADLADALDAKHRNKGEVNVKASASFIRRVFAGLDGAQAGHLVKILEGRGWSVDDIKKNIISRVKDPELKGHLEVLYGTALPEGDKEKLPKEGEQ